jgi:branched-chain amino acid transport system permease protein
MNFTNFAHGVVVTLGAYFGFYSLTLLSPSIALAFIIALVLGGIVSSIIELTTYRPLLQKNSKRSYLVIAGLGIQIIVENLIIILLGGRFKTYPSGLFNTESIYFFGSHIGVIDLYILLISILLLISVELYINCTRNGLAIRSAAYSTDVTSIMGVDVDKLMIKVFLIAGMLAGIAGYFLGIKYTAYPQLSALTNKAFISAVLGGLGSLTGSVVGAIILGLLETFVSGYISSSLRDIFSFGLLVLVLLFRPTGIMGKSLDDKA